MQPKTLMWILVLVGSVAGSYIPTLWGAGLFSFTSFIGSAIGTVLAIWLVFKLNGY